MGFDAWGAKVGADTSDQPFTIETIRVDSPNGGGTYMPNQPSTIAWTTGATLRSVDHVVLMYTVDGGSMWTQIRLPDSAALGNPGRYDWRVPGVASAKKECKVKVVLIDDDDDGRTIVSSLEVHPWTAKWRHNGPGYSDLVPDAQEVWDKRNVAKLTGIKKVRRFVSSNLIQRALIKAVKQTGQDCKAALRKEMERVFDRPTPYTQQCLYEA
jgi:hypothetical protein